VLKNLTVVLKKLTPCQIVEKSGINQILVSQVLKNLTLFDFAVLILSAGYVSPTFSAYNRLCSGNTIAIYIMGIPNIFRRSGL